MRAAVAAIALLASTVQTTGAQPAPAEITVVVPGTANGATPLYYAQRSGMFAQAGLNVRIEPLASGAADAAAVVGGAADVGNTNVLTVIQAHARGVPYTTWVAAHPDVARRFGAVMSRASVYADAHWSELLPLVSDFTKVPVDELKEFTPDAFGASVSVANIQPLIDAAARNGFLSAPFPASEIISPSAP